MKIQVTLCLLVLSSTMIWSQQYSINKSSGTLKVIEVPKVTFMGHSGADIIIERAGENAGIPERAEGLRLLSPAGLIDNTGIGLAVSEEDDETVVRKVSKKEGKRYTIKVPQGVAVLYEHSNHDGGTVEIIDVAGEVEVSANYNSVRIENSTGPLTINSVYGSIDAVFDALDPDHAITLYSVYDHVDVTVPAASKASFTLATSYGEMFSDLDLNYESVGEDMKKLSSDKISATLNGGGAEISLKSSYENVYLRKK